MAGGRPKPDAKSPEARKAVTPYWRVLRTLRTVSDLGWCSYAGGTITRRIVRLNDGKWRELLRAEVVPWARGLAAARKAADVIDSILDEKLPELCDPREDAGPRLGLQWEGMRPRIRSGSLYPLQGPYGWVYLFEAQVDLLVRLQEGRATARAAARWEAIGTTLPDHIRPDQIRETVTYLPSPDPLPLPVVIGPGGGREANALLACEREGWLTYVALDRTNAAAKRYTVKVAGRTIGLDQSDVLPFALGVADFRGSSGLVAYRDGLG